MIAACLSAGITAGAANAAEMRVHKEPQAVAAPTQSVVTKTLVPPATQSDTNTVGSDTLTREVVLKPPAPPGNSNGLEAIVDKGEEQSAAAPLPPAPPVIKKVVVIVPPSPPAKPVVATQTPPIQVESNETREQRAEKPEEESKTMDAALTQLRVFAIRWREVLDIVFVMAISLFTGLLYRVSKQQKELLARSVMAAQESAHAAHKSASIAESLLLQRDSYDEAQVSLELL